MCQGASIKNNQEIKIAIRIPKWGVIYQSLLTMLLWEIYLPKWAKLSVFTCVGLSIFHCEISGYLVITVVFMYQLSLFTSHYRKPRQKVFCLRNLYFTSVHWLRAGYKSVFLTLGKYVHLVYEERHAIPRRNVVHVHYFCLRSMRKKIDDYWK